MIEGLCTAEKNAEQPVRPGPKKKRYGKGGIPVGEMAKLMAFGSNTQIARPATKPSGSAEEVRRTIDAAEHMVAAQNSKRAAWKHIAKVAP